MSQLAGALKNCEVLPLNNGINYIGIYTRVFYLSICLSVCLAVCPSVCLSIYLYLSLSLYIYIHIICPCMCTYISLSLSFCECVSASKNSSFFDFDLDLLLFGELLGISTDLGPRFWSFRGSSEFELRSSCWLGHRGAARSLPHKSSNPRLGWSNMVNFQGLVTVPFWEYWTSPYSSHYRPYT